MNYYGYIFASDSDLAHHGIKGMKWGVRRFQNENGSLTNVGRKRYSRFFSSKDTYDRIRKIRGSQRMNYMSDRQRKSLDNAEKYWKARAEGTKPTVKRGIVKRLYDRKRSYSLQSRIGHDVAMSVIGNLGATRVNAAIHGNAAAIGNLASTTIIGTAGSRAYDEIVNKAFGHF